MCGPADHRGDGGVRRRHLGTRSKPVDEYAGQEFDWVVTVCDHANERCPVFPGETRRVHAGFEDPPRLASSARTEEEALGPYRDVRDKIRGFVGFMLRSIAPAFLLLNKTFSQVFPPFLERYTPRSGLGPNTCPRAAT